jgi:hypothetical protein
MLMTAKKSVKTGLVASAVVSSCKFHCLKIISQDLEVESYILQGVMPQQSSTQSVSLTFTVSLASGGS